METSVGSTKRIVRLLETTNTKSSNQNENRTVLIINTTNTLYNNCLMTAGHTLHYELHMLDIQFLATRHTVRYFGPTVVCGGGEGEVILLGSSFLVEELQLRAVLETLIAKLLHSSTSVLNLCKQRIKLCAECSR